MKTVLTLLFLCFTLGCMPSNDEDADASGTSSSTAPESTSGMGGNDAMGIATASGGTDATREDGAGMAAGVASSDESYDESDESAPDGVSNASDDPAAEPILDCDGACDRYDECGKTFEVFGDGGRAKCLDTCGRITRDGEARAEVWWQCLAEDACSLIHRCPVPSVQPLGCSEVCGLVESCTVGIEFADCEEECAEQSGLADCAEALTGQCQVDAFEECLARDVYSACGEYCTATIACNVAVAEGCARSCINTLLNGDGLAVANFQRTNACVQTAQRVMSCPQMDACLRPFSLEPASVPNQEQFCARYDGCDLDYAGFYDCMSAYDEARQVGDNYLVCLYDRLGQQCPDFYFDIQDSCENADDRQRDEACVRYCEAVTACGEDEDAAPNCLNECRQAMRDNPDAAERQLATLSCVDEQTCEAFNQCVANDSPAGQCERFCSSRAACGDIEESCRADCEASWPRDRHTAWRDCVTAAGDACEQVNACTLADTVPCDAYCTTLEGCGNVVDFGDDCRARCDDLQFADPDEGALFVGCTIAAANQCEGQDPIFSVESCQLDPSVMGMDCLNFCRLETDCDPFADLAACFSSCRAGLQGLTGLIYAQSRDCLAAKAKTAACNELAECTADAGQVDCEAHCQQLSDCRVDRVMCVEECGAQPPIDEVVCALGAQRTGQQCRGIAGCAGVDAPMVSENCSGFCETRGRCDAEFDEYLCELDCVDEPEALAYQLGCLEASACNDEQACLMLTAEPNEACNAVCETLVECGVTTREACLAQCTGQLASPSAPADRIATVQDCLDQAQGADEMCDADAAGLCFAPSFCQALPDPIFAPADGGRVAFNLAGAPAGFASMNCGNFSDRVEGYAQQAIVVNIAQRSNASFTVVERDFDTVISLRTDCDSVASEVACNDDSNFEGDFLASRIPEDGGTIELQPGTYYLIVDSYRALDAIQGAGAIQITINPIQP